MQLAHSTTLKWSPVRVTYENRPRWRCQERKLTSLPKVTMRRRCNDVKIERIGIPHTTVSQQAEQFTTRHSHCKDVDIEHIGASHTTVSQQAEQVRIVAGQRATQKDDRSRRKLVRRWSESQTKLHIESPIDPNINSEIEVTLLPSHDANRQSIWWRSRRWSNKNSQEGDSRVYMINRQVKSPRGGSLLRHAPTRLQRSPTNKSKAHLEAVYRDTPISLPRNRPASLQSQPRFYWSRLSRAQPWSWPDGHRSGLPMTTGLVKQYLSQWHLPITTGCKIYSTEHAEAMHRAQTALAHLNLVSITILEKFTC